MAYETLIVTQEGALAEVQFNRPESYNALNEQMARELFEVAVKLSRDNSVRAVLLTGAGKAFHAGGDVKRFAAEGKNAPVFIDNLVSVFHSAMARLVRMPKPTVAAVNGVAAGAGFSLAMSCDLVLAHPGALFSTAYARIGASPDGGMSFHLVRQIGMRRAMELYLTNRVLNAEEALAWGVVNRILPAEGFMDAARKQALELANGPTLAYARAKELFLESLDTSMDTQLEREGARIVASAGTEDFQNGVKAFAEKRPATFKGR